MRKYEYVFEDIKTKIETGVYACEYMLPSENELMELYHFSKDTIRRALSKLELYGYIQKRQGNNSIVLPRNPLSLQKISEIKTIHELTNITTLEHDIQTTVTHLSKEYFPEEIQTIFNADKNQLFYCLNRVRSINQEKTEFEVSYFDCRFVSYLDEKICQKSIYHYLESKLHLHITHSRREISFRKATEIEKQMLDLNDYDMVVVVTSLSYLSNGQLFQYGTISYRPDTISFLATAKR